MSETKTESEAGTYNASWWPINMDISPAAKGIVAGGDGAILDGILESVYTDGKGVFGSYVDVDSLGSKDDPVVVELRILIAKSKAQFRQSAHKDKQTRSVDFFVDPYTEKTWISKMSLFDALHEMRGQLRTASGVEMPYCTSKPVKTEATAESAGEVEAAAGGERSSKERAIAEAVARRKRS